MTRGEDGEVKGNRRKVMLVHRQTYSNTLLIRWIQPLIWKMNLSRHLDIVIIKVRKMDAFRGHTDASI